jgi:hypothetical protein
MRTRRVSRTYGVPVVSVLPNNLADFPSQPPWLESSDAGRRRRRRAAARAALVLVLGVLVAAAAYRWVVVDDLVDQLPLASPSTHRAPPPVDDSAPPDDPSQPALVTELLGNQPVSQNWSGYAATAGDYTAVSATWTVSEVSAVSSAGVDAAWVGIGGVRSHDLIQAGTQRTVSPRGVTQHEAWIELLPQPSQMVPLKISAGDSVSVSITQQGPETWLIALTNTTSGEAYEVTKHYASSLSSAEWVEEAPSAGRGGPLPLDDFGTLTFTRASAVRDDETVNIVQAGAHAITMITPGGAHLVEPSGPGVDGDSFSVTRTATPSPPRQQRTRRRP